MSAAIKRMRQALVEHGRRMDGVDGLAGMHAEESAFREGLAATLGDMRVRAGDMRERGAGYSCRMHGH
jgi:hypothetical protein